MSADCRRALTSICSCPAVARSNDAEPQGALTSYFCQPVEKIGPFPRKGHSKVCFQAAGPFSRRIRPAFAAGISPPAAGPGARSRTAGRAFEAQARWIGPVGAAACSRLYLPQTRFPLSTLNWSPFRARRIRSGLIGCPRSARRRRRCQAAEGHVADFDDP